MQDRIGNKIQKGDPIFFMYHRGQRLHLAIVDHFTKHGITVATTYWMSNIRGRHSLSNRIIKITDEMMTPEIEARLENIRRNRYAKQQQ